MSPVLIVGAGPGGASLAYLLARRGIEVVLFERQTNFAREFRGEVLLPGGLDALRQMGLSQEFESLPHVKLGAGELYFNGKLRARNNFDEQFPGEMKPCWTSQPALLEMLVTRSTQYPNFRFERGARVRDLIESDGRIVGIELADGRSVQGSLVIGADGRTSIVRRRSGLDVSSDPTPMDIVWCKLPLPEFLQNDKHIRAYVGRGHLLIAAPVYDGHLQIAWIIAKGSFGEIRERGIPKCLDQMAAHVSEDLADHIRRHRNDSVQPFVLSTVLDRVEPWSRPGMLLIGDAAHTMSPVGAQGINIALRDAIVAANHLVPVLEAAQSSGGDVGSALDSACLAIESERSVEVDRIQRLQAFPPRVIMSDSWWSRLALSILPLLIGSRIAAARGGRVFREFAFGVSDVQLRV